MTPFDKAPNGAFFIGNFSPIAVPDSQPAEDLFNELYQRLRLLARSHLRRNEPITLLDTTGLVHESYMRLAQAAELSFADRQHFLRSASRTMRFVVVDFIRRRRAQSRGGELMQVTLDTDLGESLTLHDANMIRLHEALDDLVRIDERLASIVEMRCYAGLGEAEIAEALGVNVRTVRRQWLKARTMLKAAME
jgi:RNA polymerase sigma factor (TIGR02999 family)